MALDSKGFEDFKEIMERQDEEKNRIIASLKEEVLKLRQENQLMRDQTEHLMRLLHEKHKEMACLHKSLDYARHKINNALVTLGDIE